MGYYLLTGEHVFYGHSLAEICSAHISSTPIAPGERLGGSVPADLESVVLSCLEKDPSARPQSAAELRDRLVGCSEAGLWTEYEARAWWTKNKGLMPASAKQGTAAWETAELLTPTLVVASQDLRTEKFVGSTQGSRNGGETK